MLLQTFEQYRHCDPANGIWLASRTAPIVDSFVPISGYPKTLTLFKMRASQYWQVRCWLDGRCWKVSARTTSLRLAQAFAKSWYHTLLSQRVAEGVVSLVQPRAGITVAALAPVLLNEESARVARGEWSLGSWQVMKNRLDSVILPYWGERAVSRMDFAALQDFVTKLSQDHTTTTVHQYVVVMRKLLLCAHRRGWLKRLPEFPKVHIRSTPRSGLTPGEYWRVMRMARALRGQSHPDGYPVLRQRYQLRSTDVQLPPDLPWAMGFMVNAFIRPSDLKTLQHRHVEEVHAQGCAYLRLTLPPTKKNHTPIVTLWPAVHIYRRLKEHQWRLGYGAPDDFLFLPQHRNRDHALKVLGVHLNWVLERTHLKRNAFGKSRSMYSFRHSALTFRLLYGSKIDLLTLAKNARTSVDMVQRHYASSLAAEQNITMLQSRRTRL